MHDDVLLSAGAVIFRGLDESCASFETLCIACSCVRAVAPNSQNPASKAFYDMTFIPNFVNIYQLVSAWVYSNALISRRHVLRDVSSQPAQYKRLMMVVKGPTRLAWQHFNTLN
jgi:hypothetical protein